MNTMETIMIVAILIVPGLLALLRHKYFRVRAILDTLGVVSALGFGLLAALEVADIRRHESIYSTKVHSLFDNLWFLSCSGYLGLYLLSLLIQMTYAGWRVWAKGRAPYER